MCEKCCRSLPLWREFLSGSVMNYSKAFASSSERLQIKRDWVTVGVQSAITAK
jgi:hypothetical protein